MIEEDDTPTDEDLDRKRTQGGHREEDPESVSKEHKPSVFRERFDYKAPPKIKRPRRQPDYSNKWNEDSKTGLMKDYMQNYRAEGKHFETNSPKSKYVKKPKV
jgi:hypothetical protein